MIAMACLLPMMSRIGAITSSVGTTESTKGEETIANAAKCALVQFSRLGATGQPCVEPGHPSRPTWSMSGSAQPRRVDDTHPADARRCEGEGGRGLIGRRHHAMPLTRPAAWLGYGRVPVLELDRALEILVPCTNCVVRVAAHSVPVRVGHEWRGLSIRSDSCTALSAAIAWRHANQDALAAQQQRHTSSSGTNRGWGMSLRPWGSSRPSGCQPGRQLTMQHSVGSVGGCCCLARSTTDSRRAHACSLSPILNGEGLARPIHELSIERHVAHTPAPVCNQVFDRLNMTLAVHPAT